MNKVIIKLLTTMIIILSLSACNKIPETTTSEELNNIYFLTDKDYTYKEIVKWALTEEDVLSSSLIATYIPIECDKVSDDVVYVDIIGSDSFDQISISKDNGYNIVSFPIYEKNDKGFNGYYNNALYEEGPYTITFGDKERYVLNNIEFKFGNHYVVFCGTVEQFLKIESHKGGNKVHNGSNKIF